MDCSPLLTGPPISTENVPESSPSLDQRTGNVPEHVSPKTPPLPLADTGVKPKINKAASFESLEPYKSQETQNNVNEPSTSRVVTLEPHQGDWTMVQNRQRQTRQKKTKQRRVRQILSTDRRFDDQHHFPKFFSMKFPRMEIDSSLNVIATDADIKKQIGMPNSIKKQNRDTLLIEVKSEEQGKKLAAIKVIDRHEVYVQEHSSMNQSKGTLYSETLSNSTLDQLYNALKGQGVTKIERMKRKISGVLTDTHRYIITFNRPELPPLIKLTDWHHELIEYYIPTPMRCINCQRLGHTKNHCRRNEPTCSRCSESGHMSRDCQKDPKCINCGGDHTSMNRKCPLFLFKSEVLATQTKLRLTFHEADDITKEKFRAENKTYSFAVKNNQPRNTAQNTSNNEATLTSQAPTQREKAPRPTADSANCVLEKEAAHNSQNECTLQIPVKDSNKTSKSTAKKSAETTTLPSKGSTASNKISQMPVLKAPVSSGEVEATVADASVKKTLADKTPSKIDESQNPVSKHCSLPKSFRKPQPQAEKPDGCGKRSEMKRSESSQSLAAYASGSDPNLTGGRRKRSNSESSPPSKRTRKINSNDQDKQAITVIGSHCNPNPKPSKWKFQSFKPN